MERTERMIEMLGDEWDNVVILASRYRNGETEALTHKIGNGFAVQQMLEDAMDDILYGYTMVPLEDEDGYEEEG